MLNICQHNFLFYHNSKNLSGRIFVQSKQIVEQKLLLIIKIEAMFFVLFENVKSKINNLRNQKHDLEKNLSLGENTLKFKIGREKIHMI